MLQQMKTTFENILAAVVEKSQERPPHHTPHPPPPPSIPEPSRSSHHRHLSSPPIPQPSHHSRRSCSIRRRSASPEIDKRLLSTHRSPRRCRISSRHRRQSSRDFSPPRDRDRSRDRRDRGRSVTLKSASPFRRAKHYEQDQDRSVHSYDMCLPVHLNHVNHHIGNNLPLRKTTIIEDTVNKIHHNGKTGTTGANGRPPPATTNPLGHPENQTTPTLQSTNTLPGTPLTSIHTILQPASLRLPTPNP